MHRTTTTSPRTARSARPAPAGGKRVQAAEEALEKVLELFDAGELPERIAETVIARQGADSPTASWSLGNQLLTLLAGTTDARGFRQWQEVDRYVKRGARAFYTLAPSTRKIREANADTGEETERVAVIGFLGIPVFRYEDTEGAELERPDYQPAEFPPLYDVAERLGVDVRYAPFVTRFKGRYQWHRESDREEIVLCSHDVSTFFHELAHAAHRRVKGELRNGQVASQEIVAETVAATLCRLYGFDGYLYRGAEYVRCYANGGNPSKAAMRVLADVQAVLALILEGNLDD